MQLLEQIQSLDFPAPLPGSLFAVEQHFDAPQEKDVADATRNALEESGLLGQIAPDASVAVAVGSRGIADYALIVATVIEQLRGVGAKPFIIPAMGSHGGATADGQRTVLAELGITPERVGAEIHASMEVIRIGQLPDGPPLYQDALSVAADHTLLIGRVKPHTDFRADIESGLAKMSLIGLGKHRGAAAMHTYGVSGFQRFLPLAPRIHESSSNLLGGLAILENAYDETAEIAALSVSEIGGEKEAALLQRAKDLMPSLPFPEIDVLVVRDMGKEISGTGMDTNTIGRLMIPRQPEDFGGPDVALIVVLDLTQASHGNSLGLGLANVTTARLVQKIDWVATYTNAITAGILDMYRAALPITMASDQQALQVAVRCHGQPAECASLVFIQDTLALGQFWVSSNFLPQVEAHPRLSVVGEVPLAFTSDGVMTSPWRMD